MRDPPATYNSMSVDWQNCWTSLSCPLFAPVKCTRESTRQIIYSRNVINISSRNITVSILAHLIIEGVSLYDATEEIKSFLHELSPFPQERKRISDTPSHVYPLTEVSVLCMVWFGDRACTQGSLASHPPPPP
jgi:hypothetical protein